MPDLNIVVATGCYTYHDVPFFFHHRTPAVGALLGQDEPEPMVPMFVGDITDGIAGTGVRAGMLKCAIDEAGPDPGRRAGDAGGGQGPPGHRVPDHRPHPSRQPTRASTVQRVMAEEGVDPGAVVLGHSGDSTDVDHLSALAEAGFWLGMDRFGINLETTFEARADTVVELCRRGLAERMVLAHDAACYIDWVDPDALAFMPQWHYLHIEQDVLPYLRDHGVTEEQVTTMLVDNPRRIFEGG